MRTGDAHVQRDFAGRIVGDGAWIVVMRPNTGVIIEFADLIDLAFGFDVAVFGDADIDPYSAGIDVVPI